MLQSLLKKCFPVLILAMVPAAQARECYLVLTSATQPICPYGGVEQRAQQAADALGLQTDKDLYISYYPGKCTVEYTKIIRVSEAQGARGKDLRFVLLTNVTCGENKSSFPIVVTMWSSHDERDTARVVAQKLYTSYL